MTITIDKTEVINDARREVEYVAAKQGDYARVKMVDGDEELLRRWITDACVTIERELRQCASPAIATDEAFIVTIRHENGRETWLNSTANTIVESKVIAEWLKITFPDHAEKYEIRAAEELAKLVDMAYYRVMPVVEGI